MNTATQATNEDRDTIGRATYSPDDNKIRIYPDARLDADTYARVKAAGFKWAPRQELFVAPMWTPGRADLAAELCGDIEDEDTTLADRAEDRADRFGDYSDKRTDDARRTEAGVERITQGIPLGQPILIGHHSERRARKHAQQIENGTRKAIQLWDTAAYWKRRAAGALAHAKYKELPRVRANRIKTIEADKRKQERNKAEAENFLALWNAEPVLSQESAEHITNYGCHISHCFTLAEYPRPLDVCQYEGPMSLWSALNDRIITPEQARTIAIPRHQGTIKWAARWIEHYTNRLTYERAMLEEQGAAELLAPKPKSKKQTLPLCNYRVPEGLDIPNPWHRGEMIHYPMQEMTKAEYARIHTDYKATRIVNNSHKVRTAMRNHSLVYVFLTDSKTHTPPAAVEQHPAELVPSIEPRQVYTAPATPELDRAAELRESLAVGVQVVSAPQLFPTPRELAERMAELADIQPGNRCLEPSAGTGRLLGAMGGRMFGTDVKYGRVHAVEINGALCQKLRADFPLTVPHQGDFLTMSADDFGGTFDRIVMNPPFIQGADIKHIKHAAGFLAAGGRLVALCANGPRQRAALEPLASYWEDLPAGSFESEGTGVNVALLVIEN